jgi:hypothetical protein
MKYQLMVVQYYGFYPVLSGVNPVEDKESLERLGEIYTTLRPGYKKLYEVLVCEMDQMNYITEQSRKRIKEVQKDLLDRP